MLAISLVFLFDLLSELTLSCWSLITSVSDILGAVGEKGELLKLIIWSFLDPSEADPVPERIRLSWERWQIIRPLFHPEKLNNDDTLSCRNANAAFAIGESCVLGLLSVRPRLSTKEYYIIMKQKTIHRIVMTTLHVLPTLLSSINCYVSVWGHFCIENDGLTHS